ncbi:DUF3046 domain-containing protein [Actinosynnema sp. NPDC047251]|uniref:DUF3046 domain-containing protein n=1 Tax=Saccharothrix espanaensis (strain ATCC 51144 / DSM 44229 / JCM 9112 / NBRC 15066 / NRRL 15764) TaxID=1179773 RepID=K0JW11_SACES|nr:DUF3046 domain-containing protein [Saccharothrix espanaensis]CCH28999.1 hypothetical protein BN6_16770 [Saccharothrix espanaensis DSM 44229]
MRNTVFRKLMSDEFGQVRAEMVARDHVLSALGGRTPDQALEAGLPPKAIWLAVCEAFDVPEHRR